MTASTKGHGRSLEVRIVTLLAVTSRRRLFSGSSLHVRCFIREGRAKSIPLTPSFPVVVLVILYSVFCSSGQGRGFGGGGRRGYNGYGGGGGGDDNDDPPPPYTPRAPKPKSYGTTRSSSSRSSSSRQQDQSWRPGFWTGTATGAAAGYAAGAYANRQDRNNARPGTSNWFGGTNTSPTYDRGGGWGGGSSSAGPSGSRHESTGFGGTRRR